MPMNDIPILSPSSSIHGWLPTDSAFDETNHEMYLVDDYRGLIVISTETGEVVRSTPGIKGLDGIFIGIQAIEFVSTSNSSTIWISALDSSMDPYSQNSLVLVQSDTFMVIRNITTFSPPLPPRLNMFTWITSFPNGPLVYALATNAPANSLYTFDSTTGEQVGTIIQNYAGYITMTSGKYHGSDAIYVMQDWGGRPSLVIVFLNNTVAGGTVMSIPASLKWRIRVDSQENLWLISSSDTMFKANSTTGQVLVSFNTNTSNIGQDDQLYHSIDIETSSGLVWATTYGSSDIVGYNTDGKVIKVINSPQAVVYQPTSLQLDEVHHNTFLLTDGFRQRVYEPNTYYIRRLSRQGQVVQVVNFTTDYASPQPYSILVYKTGDMLLFTKSFQNIVFRFTSNGIPISTIVIPYLYNTQVVWDVSDHEDTIWTYIWTYIFVCVDLECYQRDRTSEDNFRYND